MVDTKRVVVTGATGLVGQALCKRLQERGHAVVVFSRNPDAAREQVPGAIDYIAWQPTETGAWAVQVDGADALIYLAGERATSKDRSEAHRLLMRSSRVVGVRGLVNAIAQAQVKPKVFLCGSAAGYYGFEGFTDQITDEDAPQGKDFWGQSTAEMEEEVAKAESMNVRTVMVRTGIVLDAQDGALPPLAAIFRRFMGGPILPGKQWFPWIHIADEVGIFLLALEDERARGPMNASSPHPQRYRDFAATLGKVLGRPSWLPMPGIALRQGMGDAADFVTHGRQVIPKKALELGYQFQYPNSEQALKHLLGKE